MAMQFRLAIAGLICVGWMTGSVCGSTTNAPAAAPDLQSPDSDSNPYSAIVKANVFQLKEPPAPARRDEAALVNLPKINITGFRKREGEPLRALFATVPKDPKEPPKYFNLAE